MGIILSVVFVVASSLACLSAKGNIELGPLYYDREVPDSGGREGALLWPFFQWESTPSIRQYGFRPLINLRWENEQHPDKKMTEIQAVWPIFLYRRNAEEFRIRVYPIFHYTHYYDPDRPRDTKWALIPVLFGGRTRDQGSYFAIFPLGGRLHRYFGKDTVRFFMFPLYADAVDREHRSWNVLWPIFQHGHGGGKTSYRFWPLVGRKSKEGVYQKEFLLWPLIMHLRERIGLEHPTESWFFIPLYGKQGTPFGSIYYALFPLFSYQRNEKPNDRLREWTAPWPIFTYGKGDNYSKLYFWPLWGDKVTGGFETQFALYPLYTYYIHRSKTSMTRRYWCLPFYWSMERKGLPEAGGGERTIKIWPFMDYASKEERERIRLLSPLWFRDPEGFERNYSTFWQLYTREEFRGRLVSSRILWFYDYEGLDDMEDKENEPGESRSTGLRPEVNRIPEDRGAQDDEAQEPLHDVDVEKSLGRSLVEGILD